MKTCGQFKNSFLVLATWFFGSKIKLSRRENTFYRFNTSEKNIFSKYTFEKCTFESWFQNVFRLKMEHFFGNVYFYKTGNKNTYDLNVKFSILGPKENIK